MTPFRFGAPARQLYGLLQPPSGTGNRGHGVLLCNPFGQEAIRSHRLFRVLGDRLARAGFHVLHFDYLGTGDADGDDAEGDLPTWVEDVLRANEEVLRRSGHRRSSWVGLRLGATLAAMASAKASPSPDQLVLWDPVIDGSAYLEEIANAHAVEIMAHLRDRGGADRRPPTSGDGATEALGFPLTSSLQRQVRAVSCSAFAVTRAERVHIVDSGTSGDLAPVEGHLAAAGVPVFVRRIGTRIVWASDEAMNTAIVPAEVLQAIIASLAQAR